MRAVPHASCKVLLSGGVDSALVTSLLCRNSWSVSALWVDYEQPAAASERTASRALAQHYAIEWHEVVVRGWRVPRTGEIPGRNDMLVATARACAPGSSVAIGVHAGTAYADCSPSWLAAWRALLDVQYSGRVSLLAPLEALEKQQVLALARDGDVPLDLTYSCETGVSPCGDCLSCRDRQAADAGT
jgi:7-cyano-7-deazaguanine synthase